MNHLTRAFRQKPLQTAFLTVSLLSVPLGLALSETDGMFYNILIFPLAGLCAFCALRIRALPAPAAVLAVSYVWLLIKYALSGEIMSNAGGASALGSLLAAPLLWSLVYALLCMLGVLLGLLFATAFVPAARRPFWQRFASGTVACVFTIFLLSLANSLVGNPVSRIRANASARSYLSTAYPGQGLIADRAFYSFKSGSYYVPVHSAGSIDTHFTLSYDILGNLSNDSYQDDVESGWNTLMRLGSDYRALCESTFAAYPYSCSIAYADKDPGALGLVRDAVCDVAALGSRHGILCVYVQADSISVEAAAKALLALRSCFDAAGVGFASVDFTLEPPDKTDTADKSLNLLAFSYQDITAEGLTGRVEQCRADTAAYYAAADAEKLAVQAP